MPKTLQKYNDREDGFTLIELLIVVLIIGILAAIAIPVYLGIQDQAHKSTLRADVNQTVKRVQVALTEGTSISTVKTLQSTYVQNSDGAAKGEDVNISYSASAPADDRQFNVNGTMLKSAKAAIDYTYAYDSATGKFSENSSDLVLGGGSTATPPVVTTTSLLGGVVGNFYTRTLTTTGSPAPTSFARSSGTLPPGVTLNTATGEISGTPTTVGSYTFGVTATSAVATSQERSLSIVITSVPAVTSNALPDATVGVAYDYTVTASGTPQPTFSATNLPSGLSIDSATGKISGTPATSAGGTSPSVTITVNNGVGGDQTKSLTLNVNAVAPTITTAASLPSGNVGTSYSTTLAASGGTGSVTWAKTSGTIPPGLSLNTATGEISGTPTGNYADYTFTVTATATGKTSAPKTFTLKVSQDLTLATLMNADVEYGYNVNSYWYKVADAGYNGSNTIDTVNFPRHAGNWAFHTKTYNNQGSFQGIGYCAPYSVPAGVRIRYTVYASSNDGDSNTAFGGGTGLHAYVYAGGAGGGDSYANSTGGGYDFRALSGDYTTTQSGNICVNVGADIQTAQDYFRDLYFDDVSIRVGG